MARGTAFNQLVYMLRAEIRRSTNVAVGVDDLPDLKQALNRNYRIKSSDYAWPFLTQYFPLLQLNASQQYYNLPTGLGYAHIKDVAIFFSGVPQRIERGIKFEDYALFDFSTGATSDPVLKWDVRYGNQSQEQIEVWPVPSSNSQTMKFFGQVNCPYLVNDADLCLIDDLLVVLYAAADCLALDMSEPRVGLPPAAQLKLDQAKAYEATLKAEASNNREVITIGTRGNARRAIDTNSLVRVRG